MQRRYATADVFTAEPLGGKPVAVVLDAEGLTTAQMQAIAAEFNAYYRLNSPLPALAQNLPKSATDADYELDRRVREHFPLGTSTTSLQSVLVQQGWSHVQLGSGFHYVTFKRSTGPLSTEVASIKWKDENGFLSEIHGA